MPSRTRKTKKGGFPNPFSFFTRRQQGTNTAPTQSTSTAPTQSTSTAPTQSTSFFSSLFRRNPPINQSRRSVEDFKINVKNDKKEIKYSAISTIPQALINRIRNNHPFSSKNIKNRLSQPRSFSEATVHLPGHESVKEQMFEFKTYLSEKYQVNKNKPLKDQNISTKSKEDQQIIQDLYEMNESNTACLEALFNNTTNIFNAEKGLNKGGIIKDNAEATKLQSLFTNNVWKGRAAQGKQPAFEKLINISKPNPLAKGYFLKKGVGARLGRFIINDLKTRGVKFITCIPVTSDYTESLIKYYETFGFKKLEGVPRIFLGMNEPLGRYGNGSSVGGKGPIMYRRI